MKKILSTFLVASLLLPTTFASLEAIPTVSMDSAVSTDAGSVEKIGIMPSPMYNNGVTYEYDADALKALYDQKSSLIEVVCQSEDVFKNL